MSETDILYLVIAIQYVIGWMIFICLPDCQEMSKLTRIFFLFFYLPLSCVVFIGWLWEWLNKRG